MFTEDLWTECESRRSIWDSDTRLKQDIKHLGRRNTSDVNISLNPSTQQKAKATTIAMMLHLSGGVLTKSLSYLLFEIVW